jgi:hypothetical protein
VEVGGAALVGFEAGSRSSPKVLQKRGGHGGGAGGDQVSILGINERQTERQRDRQTDGWADQTDRPTRSCELVSR